MARAKLDLKRAKVQTILQLEDPAQRYAWERLEEMRKKGTLQPFLRRITTEALPMPAQPKAAAKRANANDTTRQSEVVEETHYEDIRE